MLYTISICCLIALILVLLLWIFILKRNISEATKELKKTRDEVRFDDVKELSEQIVRDCREAKEYHEMLAEQERQEQEFSAAARKEKAMPDDDENREDR